MNREDLTVLEVTSRLVDLRLLQVTSAAKVGSSVELIFSLELASGKDYFCTVKFTADDPSILRYIIKADGTDYPTGYYSKNEFKNCCIMENYLITQVILSYQAVNEYQVKEMANLRDKLEKFKKLDTVAVSKEREKNE